MDLKLIAEYLDKRADTLASHSVGFGSAEYLIAEEFKLLSNEIKRLEMIVPGS